ncbi:MAG: HlyD family efflux transporter periplasmic adaptor subunit [Saprospiraceae bacterium]|nr:HlyD family efflux transporter periplasmic adaptor subunit [Lewinella sp.]
MISISHHHLIPVFLLAITGGITSCNRLEQTSPVRKTIQEAVFASGHVTQEDEYVIAANVDGTVLAINVQEGDTVAEHQVLLKLKSDIQNSQLQELQAVYEEARSNASEDAPQLAQIRIQIEQTELQLAQDETNYLRFKDLRENNSVSQLDFEKARLQYESAKRNLALLQKNYREVTSSLQLSVDRSRAQLQSQQALLSEYILKADQAGIAIQVNKKKGELVRRGEVITRIGSGPFVLKLFVSEEDITRIETGQKAAVHLNIYPDRTFSATISKILPGFDQAEQSYIVEAQLDEMPEKLFNGTQLQANIDIGKRENVLVIPAEFLQKGKYVTLANGEQKEVTPGEKNHEWVEVTSGLSESDVLTRTKH